MTKQRLFVTFQQIAMQKAKDREPRQRQRLKATQTNKKPISITDILYYLNILQHHPYPNYLILRQSAENLIFIYGPQLQICQMPELPQVQTVRRFLQDILLRPKAKTIKSIKLFYPPIVKSPDPANFCNLLMGQSFIKIDRYGKHLILKLQKHSIISHLRMEGKYLIKDRNFVPEKHDHVQFLMTDGTSLVYNDVRKFGTMHLVEKGNEMSHPSIEKLGPEVNNEETFTPDYLKSATQRQPQKLIKEMLLDQEVVCGIGNIYADQILFASKVHPERRAKTLTNSEIFEICKDAKVIIDSAIEGKGTTISSFSSNNQAGEFQSKLKAYGRVGQQCLRCQTTMRKTKVAQRGTHFCPKCQH